MKDKERQKLRLRATLLFWALFAVVTLLGVRLYRVQVRDGAALAAGAGREQEATFDISGKRGDILDRYGVPFATSLPASAVFVQPHEISDAAATAKELAPVLGLPAKPLQAAMTGNASFVYLARNVPRDKADAVARMDLKGIGTLDEPLGLRVVPQGRVGSTLVGFTGVDNQGLAGVEYEFNDLLKGQPGQGVEATDNDRPPHPLRPPDHPAACRRRHRRAHRRPHARVRSRRGLEQDGARVSRGRRVGHHHARADRGDSRARELSEFRSGALCAVAGIVVAQSRDHRSVRTRLHVQSHHRRRRARQRQGLDRRHISRARPDRGRRPHHP